MGHMKRILPLSLLSLLAACSTTHLPPDGAPAPDGSPSPTAAAPALDGPLRVPALTALPDSAPRTLGGRFARASWADLPGYAQDDLSQTWSLFIRNCKGLMRPTGGSLTTPARATPRAWQPVCAAAADPARAPAAGDSAAMKNFLQTWLTPWRLLGPDAKPAANMVTGYYEPLVRGSRKQGGRHQWPLYSVPDNLLVIDLGGIYPELTGKRVRGKLEGRRVVPYDTRASLENSASKPPAIVYVDDPVDAFFLQVQGSGRVLLTDGPGAGTTLRVAYADHNGQPYASIGKWLADQGELKLEQASMQNIRAWAARNPKRVREMLNANPAVVFFREETIVDPELGPKGAYGIPLGAERSIAVDTSFVPLGTPVYLSTTYPASSNPLNRLVFAQDTGAAIKGAARADYYWGSGDAAGEQAGRMKQRGQMWVLWPKQAGEPSAR